jgi:hypothetical protein
LTKSEIGTTLKTIGGIEMKYKNARVLKVKELSLTLALQAVKQDGDKIDYWKKVIAEAETLEGGILEYFQRDIPPEKIRPFTKYEVW